MNSSFVRLATIAVLAIAASSMSQDARGDLFTNDNRAPGPSYHSQNGVTFFPGGAPPVQLSFFDIFVDINDRIPPPPPGNNVSSFFDIFFDVELDGTTFRGTGNMRVGLNGLPPGEPVIRSLIDTEMLSMDLLGLPNGVMLRESPTRQSLGRYVATDAGQGNFRIGSFFDVFTELSLDGGQSWVPASGSNGGSMRMSIVPEPSMAAAGMLVGLGILLTSKFRRRKSNELHSPESNNQQS